MQHCKKANPSRVYLKLTVWKERLQTLRLKKQPSMDTPKYVFLPSSTSSFGPCPHPSHHTHSLTHSLTHSTALFVAQHIPKWGC